MKLTSYKPGLRYASILLFIIILTGVVLVQFTTNYLAVIIVLLTEYIVLIMILNYITDKYVKPLNKATDTLDELVKGNFSARMYHPASGGMASLLMKINLLARSLSELSINEKIRAEQLSTVIENIQSGLILIDEKGYIHLVNKNVIDLFGRTEKDYIGYLYYDVLKNEKIHKTIQQTFLYEDNVKDFIIIDQGYKKYFEVISAPIFDDRNVLKGSVLVLYEITELKNVEKMRKDFVANVSHELKTPITSIRGFSETLLDEDLNDKETARYFLGIINEESKRLQTLIQDLLALSKLEVDDSKLNLELVNVSQVAKKVITVLSQQANQKDIVLHADIPNDVMVTADANGIKQVIINLLSNAISYTPQKGEITILVEENIESVHLMVKDTGIGIAKDALPRIFERFYRVDKARSRNTGGTGLGLAIVKHIVELHRGKITVDSKVNEGTAFHIYIPKI